jgi:DNA-binding transcriptional ArsR family regulator
LILHPSRQQQRTALGISTVSRVATKGRPVELSDPRAIRALAHAARLAVIEELYSGRELTATECAAIAGVSPSTMSYHLRSLEKAGIVERATPTGDGRERPWRRAGTYLKIDAGDSTMAVAASAALTHSLVSRVSDQLDQWTARRAAESPRWHDIGGVTSGQVWVLPEEMEALQQQLIDLFAEYRARATGGERPANSRRVRVGLVVAPLPEKVEKIERR